MQHGGVITSPHSSTNLKQLMHISTEFFHRRTNYEGGEHTEKAGVVSLDGWQVLF